VRKRQNAVGKPVESFEPRDSGSKASVLREFTGAGLFLARARFVSAYAIGAQAKRLARPAVQTMED